MKYKLFTLLVIHTILIGCSIERDEEIPHGNLESIDISETISSQAEEKIPLSQVAHKVDYIKLETSEDHLIGRVKYPQWNIQFHGDRLFISDGKNLFSFDLEGKYRNTYGHIGLGPGEYKELTSFAIKEKSKEVVIFSAPMKKLLFFSFEGKFLKSEKVDLYPTTMTSFNDEIILINPMGRRKYTNYHTMSIVSNNGGVKEYLLYHKNEKEIEAKTPLAFNPKVLNYYRLNNTLAYWEAGYDYIWKLETHSKEFFPIYSINLGSDRLPFEYMLQRNSQKHSEKDQYVQLWNVKESERFLFFRLDNKTRLNQIAYDKKQGKSYNLKFKKEFKNGANFSFYNDLDGGLPFWPDGNYSSNKLFMVINGIALEKYVFDKKNKMKDEYTIDSKVASILKNVDIMDNPILMIVTFKSLDH